MKYSDYTGAAAAITLIIFCFVPWVYIEPIQTTVSGMHTGNTNFGQPGLMNLFLCILSIILFSLKKVWAKRTNLFIVTFNSAWTIRNFILLTQCHMGDCPEKRLGIYAVIILSSLMQLMALFPHLYVED